MTKLSERIKAMSFRDEYHMLDDDWPDAIAESAALEAQRDRYRRALEEISEQACSLSAYCCTDHVWCQQECADIARRALSRTRGSE